MLTSTEANLVGPGAPGQVGAAQHDAGGCARGAQPARARRLSRTPPRGADPGQDPRSRRRNDRYVSLASRAASLLGAGCATSPPSRFYTLSGTACPAPRPSARGPSVVVGPVAIPAVVDRPEIVVTIGDERGVARRVQPLGVPAGRRARRSRPRRTSPRCSRTPRVDLACASGGSGAEADFRVSHRGPALRVRAGLLRAARRGLQRAQGRGRPHRVGPHHGPR